MKVFIPRMLRRAGWKLGVAALMLVWLSGCAYPGDQRKENQVNPAEFITVVQQAVDQFHTKTGVLPIKNSDILTPLYEKYPINFGQLQQSNYLSSIPANAFENGGVFRYVLVNVETKPEVKLLDLSAYQASEEVHKQVVDFQKKHAGELPVSIQIAPDFYYVDFSKTGMKDPNVKSTFNRQTNFNYIIQESTGVVALDYGLDIAKLIEAQSLQNSLKPDQDLRELLVTNSFFVPARSFAYTWSADQPLPQAE
ncbi:DUF3939 domain-containing protein [Paenibacillus eucommiae]|uniref:DUF3939 domain-containing protein n=1 Tax=Paenibacillus eucommiae TaxID=1355755 RepID=A0ABS4IMV7_9BACL|nr:DUF3939 domain-containing protein [Paenibacillus eucommiae]MBP1988899.1 hypothetical protein [Paenibacillus eucommiae]